jgi:hypothetical protein
VKRLNRKNQGEEEEMQINNSNILRFFLQVHNFSQLQSWYCLRKINSK